MYVRLLWLSSGNQAGKKGYLGWVLGVGRGERADGALFMFFYVVSVFVLVTKPKREFVFKSAGELGQKKTGDKGKKGRGVGGLPSTQYSVKLLEYWKLPTGQIK